MVYTNMTVYASMAEIFADIDAVRGRIYECTERLSPAQVCFKRSADSWSVAEILEHLGKADRRILQRICETLAPAEAPGNCASPAQFAPFCLEAHIKDAWDQGLKAPDHLVPVGGLTVDELLEEMRRGRAEFLSHRPRFEAHDLSQLSFPHPYFGTMNLYQWLAFVAMHENRHLRQIESLLSAPGFPTVDVRLEQH